MTNSKCYIIDTYNSLENTSDVRYRFKLGETQWCIREVEMEWGKPKRDYRPFEDYEPNFKVYEDYRSALEFARELQHLEGRF